MDCRRTQARPIYIDAIRYGLLMAAMLIPVPGAEGQRIQGTLQKHASEAAKDAQSGFFPGAINVFAGDGTANGNYVDGSLPTNVSIGSPTAVSTDSQGDVVFAGDMGNAIYMVYAGGAVLPILAAVTTQAASPANPVKGAIYQISGVTSTCSFCYTDGAPVSQAFFNNIQGMSFDLSDNLYIAAGLNMYSVFEAAHDTTAVHIVAGQFDVQGSYSQGDTIDGVPATSVALSDPTDVKTDSFGNIYLTDEANVVALVVYAGTQAPPVLAAEGVNVTASDKGNIYTIAGQVANFCSGPGTCTDAGAARGSLISGAISLSVDASGNLYVLDNYASTLRLIYSGNVAPPLLGGISNPQKGYIYTVAGLNTQFTSCATTPCGDGGIAANALFNQPVYVAVDASGNAYVDDELDHAIRKIDTIGMLSTVAGIADPNAVPPTVPAGGGAATSTILNLPATIAFDQQDMLYIADGNYNIVWNVGPAQPQTITFPKLDSPVTYGASQIPLNATASSGLAVQFSVSGPAIATGSGATATLNLTGAGTVVVTATQPGNAEFGAAPAISQTIVVNKAPLVVSAQDASKTQGQPNPAFQATYGGFVGSDTQASTLTGQPAITTTAIANSPSGTYPLTITQGTLNSNNYAFSFVNGTLTITGTTVQTINFPALTPVTYGQAALTLSGSASSGLPVAYTVISGPGKVNGTSLRILGGGTIVITASQSGNNTYAQAPSITQNLIVRPASLTVTAPTLTYPFGTTVDTALFPPPTITGFLNGDSAALVSGSAQYGTNAPSNPTGGTYTITVAAGTLALVPDAAANYILAKFVAGSLTIGAASQTISALPLPPVSYNTLYSVTASASSGLPVSFTATGPIAFLGTNMTSPSTGVNTVQFYANGVGPASIIASQPGTSNYSAAPQVVLSFMANQAELDIQANNQIQEQGAATPTLTYVIGANVQGGPLGGFQDIPAIVSGIPLLTTSANPSSSPGGYPIVPSTGTLQSPVYFFKFINGTLTVTPPGNFVITATPSSLTIPSGLSGQATLTISPVNAYQGVVTLSCGQLPANVTCAVSPATYNFPGSQNADGSENSAQGTITINTKAGVLTGAIPVNRSTLMAAILWPGAISALLVMVARRRAFTTSRFWGVYLLITLSLGLISVAACGGSKSSTTGNAAPGQVVVTINGSGTTPTGSGSVTASVPFSVTIQ